MFLLPWHADVPKLMLAALWQACLDAQHCGRGQQVHVIIIATQQQRHACVSHAAQAMAVMQQPHTCRAAAGLLLGLLSFKKISEESEPAARLPAQAAAAAAALSNSPAAVCSAYVSASAGRRLQTNVCMAWQPTSAMA